MKHRYYIFLLLGFIVSCDNSTTPKLRTDSGFDVFVEDVHASEAWLEIKVGTTNISRDITLNFDSLPDSVMSLSIKNDTIIHLEELNPLLTYSISCNLAETTDFQASQKEVNFTTMDTTSHEFEWSYWEFGDYASSYLSDITIIDENNIWAVGNVHLFDSTGAQDPKRYNLLHWDGNEWTTHKQTVKFRGNDILTPFYGISSFDAEKVWVASGLPIEKKSYGWSLHDIRDYFGPDVYCNIVHTVSSEQLYFGGKNGNLVSLTGVYWKQLNPGTDLHFYDIWGDYNDEFDEYEVLTISGNYLKTNEVKIYSVTSTDANEIASQGIEESIGGIWFSSNSKYYVVGSGIHTKHTLDEKLWKKMNGPTIYRLYDIQGENVNNIFTCGAFGEIVHFNGKSWKSYRESGVYPNQYKFKKIDYKDDLVAIVGSDSFNSVIILGRKM
ncbi:MAG: hypothetical protein SCALA702_00380 [Melioribacteraceae bacterium]|nr:MAG: hypothetical protein SCALA702_00380 [Melioribacteraceae bacterium]